jgi:hypothetical protein
MAFAVATVARGGKVVVSGLMGGNFGLPMVQGVYKRMTIEGFCFDETIACGLNDAWRPVLFGLH